MYIHFALFIVGDCKKWEKDEQNSSFTNQNTILNDLIIPYPETFVLALQISRCSHMHGTEVGDR